MEFITLKEIHHTQEFLSTLRWMYWRSEVLFSPQWLFMLIVLLLLLLTWIRIVDRSKIRSILLFGFITFAITTFLDTLGGELQLWEYPYMVLPWGPRNICIDLMISVIFMFLYQFYSNWKSFFISTVVMSIAFSFVLEPLAELLNIYKPYKWESVYSFPIYILLAISIRWITEKVIQIELANTD